LQPDQASRNELQKQEAVLSAQYQQYLGQQLNLDLTRGKPSIQQLELSNRLDGILSGDYRAKDGTDTRNYGGLDGISEARELGAAILGLDPSQVLAGGNSSLTLMHHALLFSWLYGPAEGETPWRLEAATKFICPVPGYDRHFTLCEELGIKMVTVPMTSDGPDMNQVEALIRADASIKGIWCVPKYSNPTGAVYSNAVMDRIARLGKIAPSNFRVFMDNAYALHDLTEHPPQLANIMSYCQKHGTQDSVFQFTSTSKISFSGAGIAFLGASKSNLASFKKHLGGLSIGPDKVNQLRHCRMFPSLETLKAHMLEHAELLRPRFKAVLQYLDDHFTGRAVGQWQETQGGYFISFNTRPGLAKEVVRLASEAGVKLTPAGATFPYGRDPEDRNIRIAPSVPSLEEVETAMQVFITCVELATVRQLLSDG